MLSLRNGLLILSIFALTFSKSYSNDKYFIEFKFRVKFEDSFFLYYLTDKSTSKYFNDKESIHYRVRDPDKIQKLRFNIPEGEKLTDFRIDLGNWMTNKSKSFQNQVSIKYIKISNEREEFSINHEMIPYYFRFNDYCRIDSISNEYIHVSTYRLKKKRSMIL